MSSKGSAEEERRLREKWVGTLLRDLRVNAGLTQQDLAARLRYSTAQFISNWERGVALPPLELLPRLSALWNVPLKGLVDILFRYQEEVLKREKKRVLAGLGRIKRRV